MLVAPRILLYKTKVCIHTYLQHPYQVSIDIPPTFNLINIRSYTSHVGNANANFPRTQTNVNPSVSFAKQTLKKHGHEINDMRNEKLHMLECGQSLKMVDL